MKRRSVRRRCWSWDCGWTPRSGKKPTASTKHMGGCATSSPACARAATNGRCTMRFSALPGLAEAQADEALLRHIFTNLLNNAAKYSPAGSVVEFQLEARGHLALFTVRDRGIGIPEADGRLLFQAFHR